MPAYLISTIEITDPAAYEEYRKLVAPVLQKYGGRFLARGGKIDYLEGDWRPKRVVIVEFESVEKAQAFSDSPSTHRPRQPSSRLRQQRARRRRGRAFLTAGRVSRVERARRPRRYQARRLLDSWSAAGADSGGARARRPGGAPDQ